MRHTSNDTLSQARRYRALGWSIIAIAHAEKRARIRWGTYQSKRANEQQIERWFGSDRQQNVAVITGSVSGGLAIRDFDDLQVYDQWASHHPELARTLPAVQSGNGWHFYFRLPEGGLADVRERLGASGGKGHVNVAGVELRFDTGCYTVLPPSIHPSGRQYQWHREPFNGVPIIDPFEADLVTPSSSSPTYQKCCIDVIDSKDSRDIVDVRDFETCKDIEGERRETTKDELVEILAKCAVTHAGQSHSKAFLLARHLKGLPEFEGRSSAEAIDELEPIITVWFEECQSAMSGEHDIEEMIDDVLDGFDRVKFKAGEDMVQICYERAKACALPMAANVMRTDETRLLVGLCREMHRANGGKAFGLSSHKVAMAFGIDKPIKAYRWLNRLCAKDVLKLVKRGTSGVNGRPSRYQYLGD